MQPVWLLLLPFFSSPAEFQGDYGKYASPLIFADGSKVAAREDWAKRRAEILKAWTEYLGPWPALLDKPRLEFLSQTNRENFVQHRVKVEVAKDQTLEGYLLVPNGRGPLPAVLVPYYEP